MFYNHTLIAELRQPECQAEPHIHIGKKRKPVSWFSGIARRHVRTTAMPMTIESHNMAAILKIIVWQRHAALVYCVLLWCWTSMLWSVDTYQNKVSADQYHLTISWAQVYNSSSSHVFLKLTSDQVLVFDWIVGSCQVNLLKTGQDCSETS